MKIFIGTREYNAPEPVESSELRVERPEPSSTLNSQPSTSRASRAVALALLKGPLQSFIGPAQRACVIDAFRGEERQFFYDLMVSLAERIGTMPHTYQTDGQGEDAIVHLHYFAGGQANWYITEKDKGDGESSSSSSSSSEQLQAFGRADLFGDGGELGYISIAEILANGGELDFYWTPRPLKDIGERY